MKFYKTLAKIYLEIYIVFLHFNQKYFYYISDVCIYMSH